MEGIDSNERKNVLTNLRNIDQLCNDFYKEKLSFVKSFFIYVNSNNDINKIKIDAIELNENNTITKEKLLFLIKNNQCEENINYRLLSLLKYNIDLEPSQLKNYINLEDVMSDKYNFLEQSKTIDNIIFKDTITLFHDLNCVYFIYYENNKKLNTPNTKKIYIKNVKNRKTRRKQLKGIIM